MECLTTSSQKTLRNLDRALINSCHIDLVDFNQIVYELKVVGIIDGSVPAKLKILRLDYALNERRHAGTEETLFITYEKASSDFWISI